MNVRRGILNFKQLRTNPIFYHLYSSSGVDLEKNKNINFIIRVMTKNIIDIIPFEMKQSIRQLR